MHDGIMLPADVRLASYDYALPPELIAQEPSRVRDASRLLVLPRSGKIEHRAFSELRDVLRAGDLLVANDTRVLRARFLPRRRGGGKAEILLLHPATRPGDWVAMARPGKRVRKGDVLSLDDDASIEIVDWSDDGLRTVRFLGIDADAAMARYGAIPLPPYIEAPPADADERYQTVYAERDGSVAAPTAGLHFTSALIAALAESGVGMAFLTLDVGAGTFRPVTAVDVRDHVMHAERFEISEITAESIASTREAGGRIVAVGTTTLRALESAIDDAGVVVQGSRTTSLFVYPPYRFRVVDALITNFHLPRSSLLMLVSAFAGRDRVLAAYAEAIAHGYRFYSFGDAMFVDRLDASM